MNRDWNGMPFCVPGVSFEVSQPEGGWPVATNISSNSELLEFWSILSSLSFMSLQPTCNCYGRHFNHGLYITYTLQAPKKEEVECHRRQIVLQRNAENRALVIILFEVTWPHCMVKNPDASFFLFFLFIFGLWYEGHEEIPNPDFPSQTC